MSGNNKDLRLYEAVGRLREAEVPKFRCLASPSVFNVSAVLVALTMRLEDVTIIFSIMSPRETNKKLWSATT